MSDNVDTLILDLLEWLGPEPRPYGDVLEAWRTSCPRLPVWEDACARGFIARRRAPGRGALVSVSAAGAEHLRRHRRGGGRVRTAELAAALCLATDLAMAFPFEHGLHSTLIAMRLADRLGVDDGTRAQTYYACLLAHAGCTADAHVTPEVFTASCEVAGMLGEGLGVSPWVRGLLAYRLERWDGHGPLVRAKGEEIPLPMRIVHLAVDAAFQRMLGGDERVARLVRQRAGRAFDPSVAACLTGDAERILALDAHESVWQETLDWEPSPPLWLEGEALDRALGAMGGFADLISPYLAGHSAGVAELAVAAAQRCGIDGAGVRAVRRAALVHDLGRVAVDARVWQKRAPLTADELEQVRLHPYHSERVLARSEFLSALAPVAGAHHERLDGSGYHRAAKGADLPLPARLLAAADAYHAMTEPRPHRAPIAPEQAAEILCEHAGAGRLDADAVTAVVESAGQRAPRIERPAGLTEREVEVVRMLARGLQTKQVARTLGISPKTADRHIQNAYRKIGVSTRAAATLFAMQQGLMAWGEHPISPPSARP
jgi:HD-GYP domain-containing protein (c-di-GMP phosphodiesterase class II)